MIIAFHYIRWLTVLDDYIALAAISSIIECSIDTKNSNSSAECFNGKMSERRRQILIQYKI